MRNKIQKHQKIGRLRLAGLAFLAGCLGSLAMPPLYFLPGLIFMFGGLLWLFEKVSTFRGRYFVAFMVSFGYFVVGLYWIGFALPNYSNQWYMQILAPLAVVGLGLLFASVHGFCCLFIGLAQRPWAKALSLGAGWGIAEWVRGELVFGGFPWNFIGHSAGFSVDLSQFVALVGIYGLSLLMTIAACFGGVALVYPSWRLKGGFLCLLLPLLAFGYGQYRLHDVPLISKQTLKEKPDTRLVQGGISQKEKWDPIYQQRNLQRYLRLSQQEKPHSIHLFLWPEMTVTSPLKQSPSLLNIFKMVFSKKDVLITGTPYFDAQGHIFNSAQVINQGKVVAQYEKSHLVPFGEYNPILKFFGGQWGGIAGKYFSKGGRPHPLFIKNIPPFNTLICYEIVFPKEAVFKKEPKWLLNLTNDGWYEDTAGPRQHLAIARFRAIEEGLPLVRVAYNGISAVVDSYGRTLATIPYGKAGVIDFNLKTLVNEPVAPPLFKGQSLYDIFWGYGLTLLLSLLGFIVSLFRRNK